jgi:hypothetical protein
VENLKKYQFVKRNNFSFFIPTYFGVALIYLEKHWEREKVHVTVTLTAVSVGFHIPTCQRKKIGLQRQTINSRKTERYSTESILKAFIDRWNRKTERLKLQCMQITKQNHRRDQSLYPHKTFQVNQWKVGCLLNHTTALKYKERERERETERESWSFWIMCLLVNKRQFEFYLKCVS